MRKVNIYLKKGQNDVKKRVALLRTRLVETSHRDKEVLHNSITRFSKYASNNDAKIVKINSHLANLREKQKDLRQTLCAVEDQIYTARTDYGSVTAVADKYKNNLTYAKQQRNLNRIILDENFISDEVLAATAIGLGRLENFLDPRVPVTVSKNFLSFTTTEIRIRDLDGKPLQCNFGQFSVEVNTAKNTMGGSDISIYARPAGLDTNRRDGYPHPHVGSDDRPCLGTLVVDGAKIKTGYYIKSVLLPNYRIVEIVELFQEFFTTYVYNDAYQKLHYWIGRNRWDSPGQVCNHCRGLMMDPQRRPCPMIDRTCQCLRDKTGALVTSQDELAPCGYTWNYCFTSCRNCNT